MATDNKALAKAWDLDRLKVRGGVVYLVQMVGTPYVKIGTAASFYERMKHLQTASPFDLTVLLLRGGVSREAELHSRFDVCRVRGEWFRRTKAIDAFIEHSQEEAWEMALSLSEAYTDRAVEHGETMARLLSEAGRGR